MKSALFLPFVRDIFQKLKWRFWALILFSVFHGLTDGARIVFAFLLFPFLGITPDPKLYAKGQAAFQSLDLPFTLITVSMVVALAFLGHGLIRLTLGWYQTGYAHHYAFLWRQDLIDALGKARWRFFLNKPQGHLSNAISQETLKLQAALQKFQDFFSEALVATSYILAAFWLSAKATLLLMLLGSTVVVVNNLLLQRVISHSRKVVQGNLKMMALAEELTGNLKVLKASGVFGRLHKAFAQPLRQVFVHGRLGAFMPVVSRASAEIMVMLAVVGALLALQHFWPKQDKATLLMVLVLFMRAYGRITVMLVALQQTYANLGSFEFVHNFLHEIRAEEEPGIYASLPFPKAGLRSGIHFEGVTVSHDGKRILEGIDLTIPACNTVAVVGSSGSGKTTLVDTLLRLNEPIAGSITVDGTPLQDYNIASWREAVGYVIQDTTLFDGTLADNIRWFRPEATDLEVREAAALARAHNFIKPLPDGYATRVGPQGLKLSGGERQRIALARALIVRPAVLILDEATSSLDTLTEESVMEAIYGLGGKMTIILIAHRLSTVKQADEIIVLKEGRVVEQGSWEHLVKAGQHFAALWRKQGHLNTSRRPHGE